MLTLVDNVPGPCSLIASACIAFVSAETALGFAGVLLDSGSFVGVTIVRLPSLSIHGVEDDELID